MGSTRVSSNLTGVDIYIYIYNLFFIYTHTRIYKIWVRSSVVEHGIADPMVAGSIPVTPFFYIFIYIHAYIFFTVIKYFLKLV